jgi:hypothetical protein
VLFLVLLLVLAALGLLVPALTTGDYLWAWLSVGLSGVAAAVLLLDWLARRRTAPPLPSGPPFGAAQRPSGDSATERIEPAEPDESTPVELPSVTATLPDDDEPAEEDTDAADLLTVSELTDQVRVVDERPRYHLPACDWLAARPTLGLPVREARQLGFTPCAVCRPDQHLAAQHRATR